MTDPKITYLAASLRTSIVEAPGMVLTYNKCWTEVFPVNKGMDEALLYKDFWPDKQ